MNFGAIPENDAKEPRRFGGLKGLVLAMSDNFNDELDDFSSYGPRSETGSDLPPERSADEP